MVSKKADLYVLAGTSKGAFIFQSDSRRQKWRIKGPFLRGSPVLHMAFDQRDAKTIYAAVNSGHFGPTVCWTKDLGRTWKNAESPPRFAEGSGLTVAKVWHVEPGHADEAGVVFAGVEPAALFRSEDGANAWKPVDSLNNHPTRSKWEPGGGGLCLHSIVVDPSNLKRMYVGISAVGVFRSDDSGQTWNPKNNRVRADFLADKYPEFGQCVHKLLVDPNKPSHLYQQNHCGVYRSEDAAESWIDVSKGLPTSKGEFSQTGFGFPLAVHPHKSGTIYVLPEEADNFRAVANREFAIYTTSNAGKSWRKLTNGLPRGDVYLGCWREGLATDKMDPAGVYVGTRMGHIFYSADEGRRWQMLAQWLPPVYSVSTATVMR